MTGKTTTKIANIAGAGSTTPVLAPDTGAPLDENPTSQSALKLRTLVERVVEATGGNKKGVKEVVEATLAQLGAALAKGEELNLPGLGKMRVVRTTDRAGRTMMTLKLRSAGAAKPKQGLADASEDV